MRYTSRMSSSLVDWLWAVAVLTLVFIFANILLQN